jgi:hypothetical protein
MLPVIALFVWAGVCSTLVQNRHRWVRGLGGVVTIVGALVCANAMLHII